MRLLLILSIQLTLWVSGLYAFFPYYPESRCDEDSDCTTTKARDVTVSSRSFRLSQRTGSESRRSNIQDVVNHARRKYAQQGLPVGTNTAKRADSVYQILPATPPTLPKTEGVNQDGTDFSYFIEIGMGSRQKPLYMLIDTGAGTTWVMSSTCESSPCGAHQTFGPDDSDTLDISDTPFNINYGSGSVSGHLATDSIHFAGFNMDFELGLANVTSDDFNHFPFDGILGLGMNKGTSENFVQELIEEKLLEQNVFGVYLNRASDGDHGGEIIFGGVNPEKFTGDIVYTGVDDPDRGDWVIPMDDFSYGDKNANVDIKLAYVDTGTSYAFGPPEEVARLYALMDGAESTDDVTYTVPCDGDGELAVAFSGTKYVISAKDWRSKPNSNGVCTGNIYGIEVVRDAWLLGGVFLKNVYAVFDADNKQIGFASRTPAAVSSTPAADTAETATEVVQSPPGTISQSQSAGAETTVETTSTTAPVQSPGFAQSTFVPTAGAPEQVFSCVYTVVCVVALMAAAA